MKSENQIRSLINYLDNVFGKGFDKDGTPGSERDYETFTSPITIDDDGEPMVYEGQEASVILGNLQMTMKTLRWVLEEGMIPYKHVEDEAEAEHYKDKIGYDGDGKAQIPDTSITTFIAGMEGHW